MGFVGLLYWLFPEYHADFYARYFSMLAIVLPAWVSLALPYFFFVDRKMARPLDGYWHMGKLVTLQWDKMDGKVVGSSC